ncbi:MAG: hypothetical protein D6732_09530 [Methanobacteriota archaeon]|nr:MAG: hypothetical protein D6732_09530 [Euryarchaeota archaeon]
MNASNQKDFLRILRKLFTGSWLFVVVFLGINLITGQVLVQKFGFDPAQSDPNWVLASRLFSEPIPRTAERSLFPPLLMLGWQSLFGASSLSAFVYKLLFYAGFILVFWRVVQKVCTDRLVTILAVYFTILSPYLAWAVYISPEVSPDLLAISLIMWCAVTIYTENTFSAVVGLGAAGALATLIREPNILVFPAISGYLYLSSRLTLNKLLMSSAVFLAGISPLIAWNYYVTGAVTLSTRSGINLLIGNNPYYLEIHPRYDIEHNLMTWINSEFQDQLQNLDEIERDRFFRKEAFKYMRSDPVRTIHLLLLKTLWWFGPTRIPNSNQLAYLLVNEEMTTITLKGRPDIIKDLMYNIHRIAVLTGVLFLLYWKHPCYFWKKGLLLLMPTLALLPLVILTFPDTRFRLAFDPYLFILASFGYSTLVTKLVSTFLKS